MKRNISAILGVLGAYLVCVADANRWDVLAVETRECANVIVGLVILSFILGFLIRVIMVMFKGND